MNKLLFYLKYLRRFAFLLQFYEVVEIIQHYWNFRLSTKRKILVVEDNKELAKSLSGHLSVEGYEVSETHNGEGAVSLLKEITYAIVILDLKLPKLSGFDVLTFIKKNSPGTKVVVLTAYADPMNVTMCKELGADDVIAKPYDLEYLFETINTLLKK